MSVIEFVSISNMGCHLSRGVSARDYAVVVFLLNQSLSIFTSRIMIFFFILQTTIHMLLELADSAILPYKLERFPKQIKNNMEILDKNNVTKILEENNASLKFVKAAIDEFEVATSDFMGEIKKVKERNNPLELRIMNDQMMHLERVFLLPRGNTKTE